MSASPGNPPASFARPTHARSALDRAALDRAAVDLGAAARLVVDVHRAAPCAVVGAAHFHEGSWRFGWGSSGKVSSQQGAPEVDCDAIFDLASLSKPITALTLARCQRLGVAGRHQALGELLPELAETAAGAVSLDLLSAHRSGLQAHVELFEARLGAVQPTKSEALARAAQAQRPECVGPPPPQGYPPIYSDLGYMLVGEAICRAAGLPLDELVAQQVASPLGLTVGSVRMLGVRMLGSERSLDALFVPTEEVLWRGGVLRRVVHDENAWVLADDGSAGHAGLFGDVRSVVELGVAVLDALAGRQDAWLSREELEPLLNRRPGGTHCAGFDRRGEKPTSGRFFGPETFGHLGFTGTSIWLDPERELVGVLLSNRVHPTRENVAISAARPAAYDALFSAMLG